MNVHIQTGKMDRTARKRWISKNMPFGMDHLQQRKKKKKSMEAFWYGKKKKKEVDRRTPFV